MGCNNFKIDFIINEDTYLTSFISSETFDLKTGFKNSKYQSQ